MLVTDLGFVNPAKDEPGRDGAIPVVSEPSGDASRSVTDHITHTEIAADTQRRLLPVFLNKNSKMRIERYCNQP
jgi:hypothetical protein